jgi:hypothetical protein
VRDEAAGIDRFRSRGALTDPELRMPHGSGIALAVVLVISAVIIGCGLCDLMYVLGVMQ